MVGVTQPKFKDMFKNYFLEQICVLKKNTHNTNIKLFFFVNS